MRFLLNHRRYLLPFRASVRTAHGVWAEREGVYLRLEDGQGNVGYGEVAPIPWFGTETVDEALGALEQLAGNLDDEQVRLLPVRLACLKGGLTAAIADARRTEETNAARPGVDFLPLAGLLPAGRAALAAVCDKADAGFRVFKWKVGVEDAADERAMLDDLVAALPEGGRLRLDANGAWDRRTAQRWLEHCADRPVEFVEQPVAPDSRGADDLLLGLAGDFPTPIALDESLVRDGDVERWLGLGWPGVYVVKTSLLASPEACCAALSRARARVVFSSALETGLGAKAALGHAFAWDGERLAMGMGVWPLFEDSRFDGPPCLPFVRRAQVDDLNPENLWNALS